MVMLIQKVFDIIDFHLEDFKVKRRASLSFKYHVFVIVLKFDFLKGAFDRFVVAISGNTLAIRLLPASYR